MKLRQRPWAIPPPGGAQRAAWRKVVLIFSSPNICKEMPCGGTALHDHRQNSLARVRKFPRPSGAALNHVGDWGTQFGHVITHLKAGGPEALSNCDAVESG